MSHWFGKRAQVQALLAGRDACFARIDALTGPPVDAAKTRVHGDYHLGQVLVAQNDFYILDFEGEPARPLAERRAKSSPLKDVAGMLRSFDYAACQDRTGGAWAAAWSRASRAAYCQGYAEASGHDPLEQRELLLAYETDKAVYEVLYEARHRPAWLHVPMAAIRRLAQARL